MNGDLSHDTPAPNNQRERQWKLHEEKQRAKQQARKKHLDFARPVSAIEPGRFPKRGEGEADRMRRPESATAHGEEEEEEEEAAAHNGAVGTVGASRTTASTRPRRRLPGEGQGDGVVRPKYTTSAQVHRANDLVETEQNAYEDDDEDDVEDIPMVEEKPSNEIISSDANPKEKEQSLFKDFNEGDKEDETEKKKEVEKDSTLTGNDDGSKDVPITDTVFTPLSPILSNEDLSSGDEADEVIDQCNESRVNGERSDDSDDENNDDADDGGGDDQKEKIEATACDDETTKDIEEDKKTFEDDVTQQRKESDEHLRAIGTNVKDFLVAPIPKQMRAAFCCRLRRRAAGYYELYAESYQEGNVYLMTAVKRKKASAASTFAILTRSRVEGKMESTGMLIELGGVKSNVLGTHFTVYRNNPLQYARRRRRAEALFNNGGAVGIEGEMAVISYEPNILGLKGPRRVSVAMPGMSPDGSIAALKPKQENDSIITRLKNKDDSHLIKMESKPPTWNKESQSFVLNFGGRVSKASIKNFQMVHAQDPDYIVFQFGRVSADEFTLDFRYPVCPLQAFGFALSSLTRKLACE